mgnify:CR=1 FL=1
MIKILWYFLPAILAIGFCTSFLDIRENKIRNKYVIAGILAGILIHAAIVLLALFKGEHISLEYFSAYGLNILLSFIIAVALWEFGMWSAGDAKLFIAYVFLVPMSSYSNSSLEIFHSLIILVNTFLPYFAYLVILGTFNKNLVRNATKALRKNPGTKIMSFFVRIFVAKWLVDLILATTGFNPGRMALFGFYMTIFFSIQLLFGKIEQKNSKFKPVYALIVIILARLFITPAQILSINFLVENVIFGLVLFMLRFLVMEIVFASYEYTIKLDRLKSGMVLAYPIVKNDKSVWQTNDEDKTKDKKPLIKARDDGLTKEEIHQIKKHLPTDVKVNKTVPFAPFIFAGVILTIIFQGPFFVL